MKHQLYGAGNRNPNSVEFPQKVNHFLQVLVPHCFFSYLELQLKQSYGPCTFTICHSIQDFLDVRRAVHLHPGLITPQQPLFQDLLANLNTPATRPLLEHPLCQLLYSTFKFDEPQLSQAYHTLYHSTLTIVTNLKPLLSEQLDLRAAADFITKQAKQKVIEYIKVRVVAANCALMRDEGDLEVAFCQTQVIGGGESISERWNGVGGQQIEMEKVVRVIMG